MVRAREEAEEEPVRTGRPTVREAAVTAARGPEERTPAGEWARLWAGTGRDGRQQEGDRRPGIGRHRPVMEPGTWQGTAAGPAG